MNPVVPSFLTVLLLAACSRDHGPAASPASSDPDYNAPSSSTGTTVETTSNGTSTGTTGAGPTTAARSTDQGTGVRSDDTSYNRSDSSSPDTGSRENTAAAPAAGAPRAADNTGVNERDRGNTMTPPDQHENGTDLEITQKIRQAVMADSSLSFTAKNAKIITANGRVTLRGTVKSDAERSSIVAAANKVVGASNVDNQLEVKK